MAGICSESREKSTCRCWSVVTAGVVGAARGVAAQAKWQGAGSAPRSGRGGRRFKSCHSDHFPEPPIAYAASYAERNSTSDPDCRSPLVQRERIARVRKDQIRILLDSGAQGAQAELAELHVVRHLETFPHVHDPELARSPTVFGTHSRGHLGRFLTDFLLAP